MKDQSKCCSPVEPGGLLETCFSLLRVPEVGEGVNGRKLETPGWLPYFPMLPFLQRFLKTKVYPYVQMGENSSCIRGE